MAVKGGYRDRHRFVEEGAQKEKSNFFFILSEVARWDVVRYAAGVFVFLSVLNSRDVRSSL